MTDYVTFFSSFSRVQTSRLPVPSFMDIFVAFTQQSFELIRAVILSVFCCNFRRSWLSVSLSVFVAKYCISWASVAATVNTLSMLCLPRAKLSFLPLFHVPLFLPFDHICVWLPILLVPNFCMYPSIISSELRAGCLLINVSDRASFP
jgi:hypothetical protein